MKQSFINILIVLQFITVIAQNKTIKTFKLHNDVIEIEANNLDDITISNSKNNKCVLEITDENNFPLLTNIEKEKEQVTLSFKKGIVNEFESDVFKKYITTRLERASISLKIPKNTKVIIYGENVGVKSKNYIGDLSIYIQRGNVYLGEIKRKTHVKLFLGNVFATINNQTSLDIKTTNGQITKGTKKTEKKALILKRNNDKKLVVNSINANISLTIK